MRAHVLCHLITLNRCREKGSISAEKLQVAMHNDHKKDLAVTFCISDLMGLPSQIVTINLFAALTSGPGRTFSIECEATRSWRLRTVSSDSPLRRCVPISK